MRYDIGKNTFKFPSKQKSGPIHISSSLRDNRLEEIYPSGYISSASALMYQLIARCL